MPFNNKMDNQKLIELVRDYNLLYDLSDTKYSENQKKDQAWNEIEIQLKRNSKYIFYFTCFL